MWEYEYTQNAAVPAATVWQAWADVPGWRTWNPDVTAAAVDGPFGAGSTVEMTLGSGDVIPLRLVEVVPGERFTDEASLDGIVVRTLHRVDAATDGDPAGGCRVTYATQVSGEAPEEVLAEVGAGITADFPQTVAALLAHCAAVRDPA